MNIPVIAGYILQVAIAQLEESSEEYVKVRIGNDQVTLDETEFNELKVFLKREHYLHRNIENIKFDEIK